LAAGPHGHPIVLRLPPAADRRITRNVLTTWITLLHLSRLNLGLLAEKGCTGRKGEREEDPVEKHHRHLLCGEAHSSSL